MRGDMTRDELQLITDILALKNKAKRMKNNSEYANQLYWTLENFLEDMEGVDDNTQG